MCFPLNLTDGHYRVASLLIRGNIIHCNLGCSNSIYVFGRHFKIPGRPNKYHGVLHSILGWVNLQAFRDFYITTCCGGLVPCRNSTPPPPTVLEIRQKNVEISSLQAKRKGLEVLLAKLEFKTQHRMYVFHKKNG